MIQRHLDGKTTYGIFNGNTVNKFITFDIDYADDSAMARWATFNIIQALESEFNIRSSDIHVSFSGNKGYHVDLYFDKAIKADDAKSFYERVINTAGLPSEKVEFRPSYTQAVKLPLGIHQKTGKRCWFVDRETLEPIESFDYLNDVASMDHSLILDALIDLSPEQEAEFHKVVERTDIDVNVVTHQKAQQKVIDIINAGQLLHSNSRHETTLLLATFCNTQGYAEDEAVSLIMDILHNTPSDYFSEGSKPEFWRREAERIVKRAFDCNYQLGNENKPVTVYKSEILAVLSVGTFRQKQLAYAMLMTSKRYGNTFYLTVNTAMRMLGTTSRETVQNAIEKLIEVGFIEYVRKGELDMAQSKVRGHPFYKPNRYRILIEKPKADERSIDVTAEQSLVDVSFQLFDTRELKRIIKRSEFGGRWAR
ncbi:hypothetical protein EK386_12945 [Lysinibacillus antri]|uniref:TOTE conflict system primase domain-containing protein n=2 Tax=Lysinibacillus antri TaxID=2498145 RepID=A0A432LAL6_9BACI|nr:hypothetical protein EK386_12945 [Lysinibacillus antri]